MGGVEILSRRGAAPARDHDPQVDVRAFVEEISEILRLADDAEAAVARRSIFARQVVVKQILVVSANDQAGQSDPALFSRTNPVLHRRYRRFYASRRLEA